MWQTQINNHYNNQIFRLDIVVLTRICAVLNYTNSDLNGVRTAIG
ncbi:hypothetical protein AALC25_10510 [Lachnospiraceae bacterium 29-84]